MKIRLKDKVEKYIVLMSKKYPMEEFGVVESAKSRYFSCNGRVMRVSDHIGANSSGNFSIIIPRLGNSNYIIHVHKSGELTIMSYEQIKKFIESFVMCSQFMSVVEQPGINIMVDKTDKDSVNIKDEGYILGRPAKDLTKAQINQIKSYFMQNDRNRAENLKK